MSSDEYFDDVEFTTDFFNQLDQIETAGTQPVDAATVQPPQPLPPQSPTDGSDDEFACFTSTLTDAELAFVDQIANDYYNGVPVAGPSGAPLGPTTSRALIRNSSGANNCIVGQTMKTKQWDYTVFAQVGWRKPHSGRGKEKALGAFDDEAEDEEDSTVVAAVVVAPEVTP